MFIFYYVNPSYINNMPLKIVRHKNCGCVMGREESEDPCDNRFFWSFFDHYNRKTVKLQIVESPKKKIIDYSCELY